MAERQRLSELQRIIQSGEAVLFTGAGFSAEAKDRHGNPLPDGKEMVADLWKILFNGDPPDDSTLSDLYDVALLQAADDLRAYLERRLRIGDQPLPQTFQRWFSAPWHRIYTLNVDDLEVAVSRQFELPRPLVPVSALATSDRPHEANGLEVVHLNGIAGDAASDVTFSTMQYAARLSSPDREYERLVHDLSTRSFVFVGTTLDEVIMWKHVQREREIKRHGPPRRHSFLIASHLTRARQVLLDSHKIHWIQATSADIADQLLG